MSEIEGVSHNTILTIMAEVGLKLDKFDTAKQFTSWLGLAPNRRITGGKVISSKTSKNTGRLAKAFRDAANVVGNQKDTCLSDCFRKTAYGKGRKTAIIKTARKIAIIVFNMLKKGENYQPFDYEKYEAEQRRRKILNIQRTMEKMDIDISELAM